MGRKRKNITINKKKKSTTIKRYKVKREYYTYGSKLKRNTDKRWLEHWIQDEETIVHGRIKKRKTHYVTCNVPDGNRCTKRFVKVRERCVLHLKKEHGWNEELNSFSGRQSITPSTDEYAFQEEASHYLEPRVILKIEEKQEIKEEISERPSSPDEFTSQLSSLDSLESSFRSPLQFSSPPYSSPSSPYLVINEDDNNSLYTSMEEVVHSPDEGISSSTDDTQPIVSSLIHSSSPLDGLTKDKQNELDNLDDFLYEYLGNNNTDLESSLDQFEHLLDYNY